MKGLPLSVAALAVLAAACARPESPTTGEVASEWGHLEQGLDPRAPQFLINKKRGETFRACMPRYMSELFPGVRGEVQAAVNVWASYLGRAIPIQVVEADLPRARADQSPDSLSVVYHAACGAGFDVVLGLAPLRNQTVGQTGYVVSAFPDGRVVSFRRYLFLRDYDASPADDDGVPATWISLEKRTGSPTEPSALLARMLERSVVQHAAGNVALTLPVLTHEMGHVWGLCDQYEGTPGCDPAHSSTHPAFDAIMGRSARRERLYLTDDDVEGLRQLATRPGFAHDWGAAPSTAPAPIRLADVELARIEGVKRDGQTLVMRYGLVTHKPTRVAFFMRSRGSATWTPLEPVNDEPAGVDSPLVNLSIALGPRAVAPQEVKLEATMTRDDGTRFVAASVEAAE